MELRLLISDIKQWQDENQLIFYVENVEQVALHQLEQLQTDYPLGLEDREDREDQRHEEDRKDQRHKEDQRHEEYQEDEGNESIKMKQMAYTKAKAKKKKKI